MSKKNKNKRKLEVQSAENVTAGADKNLEKAKTQDLAENDFKKEFRRLLLIIAFILIILVVLYYYDQQSNILDEFTRKIIGFFNA